MKTIIFSTLTQIFLITLTLGSFIIAKVGFDPLAISFLAISLLWNLLGLALVNYFYYWVMVYLSQKEV
jgi:predicted membrane-bound spermidine synthase